MAIAEKLKTFLEASRVKYTAAKHPVVYTAQEIAAAQHVPGRQLAKCVLVNTDRGPILAVVPAIYLIDLKKLKAIAGAKSVAIAKESDIKTRFPDVEVGAMSPFGHLYQVPVIVERVLEESEEIVFNAGSHTDTIKMRYRDFVALAKPQVGAFGLPLSKPGGRKKKSKAKPARGTRRTSATTRRSSGKQSSRRPARRTLR